jgi:hypothetical protein
MIHAANKGFSMETLTIRRLNKRGPITRAIAAVLCFVPASSQATAQQVSYEITARAHKDASSDKLYASEADSILFQIMFTLDTTQAKLIQAGSAVNLPNHADVAFAQEGHLVPWSALSAFSFVARSGSASFKIEDVIANPETSMAVIFIGPLASAGINIVLANEQSGYLEIGIPDCEKVCELENGIIIDSAGPFGTIEVDEIAAR